MQHLNQKFVGRLTNLTLALVAAILATGCRVRPTGSQVKQGNAVAGQAGAVSSNGMESGNTAWESARLWYRFAMGREDSGKRNLDGEAFYVARIRDYGDERHPDIQPPSKKYKYDEGDLPKFEETFPICFKHSKVPGTTAQKLRLYAEPCAKISETSQHIEEFDLKLDPYDYYPTAMYKQPQVIKSRALITKTIGDKVYEVGDVGCARAKNWRSSPTGLNMYSIKSLGVLTQIVAESNLLGYFSLPQGNVFTETHDEKVVCSDALKEGAEEPIVLQVNHLCTGTEFKNACSIVMEKDTWKPKRIDLLDDQAFDASVLSCSACYPAAGKFFYSRRTTKNSGISTGPSDSLEICEKQRADDSWCQNNRDFRGN